MQASIAFRSHLLFLVKTTEIRAQVVRTMAELGRQEPVSGTNGILEFVPEMLQGESELWQRLKDLLTNIAPVAVILVSDQLAISKEHDGYQPSGLTEAVRESFRQAKALCGLVAILKGAEHRTLDIDRCVTMENMDVGRLRSAITKTAMGLWMKSPTAFQPVLGPETEVVQVRVVQSETELRRCMALRYQVYDLMGYLTEEIACCKARLEMDSFDMNAIHFIAVNWKTGEIAGTTRLVLQEVPRFLRESIIGTPTRILELHRGWCRNIADDTDDTVFLRRIEHPYFASLPILQSSDFKERWAVLLQNVARGGELSRVVVAPPYRGLGVSRLLVRMAIATAIGLQKCFLLLECIPTHAKMYARYGFQLLEGHHCRAQELDQVAVGMRLELHADPPNETVSLAQRDFKMVARGKLDSEQLFKSRFLCLCQITPCWRDGNYTSRGKENCPLRNVFMEMDG